jgi:hypothetical protein
VTYSDGVKGQQGMVAALNFPDGDLALPARGRVEQVLGSSSDTVGVVDVICCYNAVRDLGRGIAVDQVRGLGVDHPELAGLL